MNYNNQNYTSPQRYNYQSQQNNNIQQNNNSFNVARQQPVRQQTQQYLSQNVSNQQSTAMMVPGALQKAGMNVQRIKQIHKNIADDVIKTIENSTQREREAVKLAIENLRTKEKQVMESNEIKSKVEKMGTIGDQLENQMSQIKIAYNRAVRELKKICSTQEEFYKKLQELDGKMEEALLNEDEKKMMKAIKSQLQSSFGSNMNGNVRMIMM